MNYFIGRYVLNKEFKFQKKIKYFVIKMNKDFVIETSQKFISNVLGSAGAVWGSSEIICLRNQNNRRLWRGISGSVGIFFFGTLFTR